ncbi:hypothetical protein BJY01DRAFT_24646 [Aspergillus pseudoustus]|uniref:Zn(2)-C6 fungal-type domain-containing protein n=1 Tax=Aspergillus pseudoustus TaxID=1810923 RepID=A0ABR4JIH3_9EURO
MQHQSHSPDEPSLITSRSRPGKRACTDAPESGKQTPPAPRSRARAAIACVRCRDRKSRCDGGRPVCGYCARISAACEYDIIRDAERALSHDMGVQILEAIQQLTQLVRAEPRREQADDDRDSNNFHTPALPPSVSEQSHPAAAQVTGCPSGLKFTEGLDSIFSWRVFPAGLDPIPVDDGRSTIPMPDELPRTSFSELTRLQTSYCRVVHSVNPILDLGTLDYYIAHVAENGFDWTTRTCLVALVCAIGAICHDQAVKPPLSPFTVNGRNSDVDVAYRFWSVACKRLGRAMSEQTLESAQCLCLAGIWFMCNLRPLDAWNHFTMAGNCCYATMLARKSRCSLEPQTAQPLSQVIEDSIFYTAYKSELEIRYELAIPGSVLEYIEDQLVFPSPPTPSHTSQLEGLDEETVSWYYYLSEIAARHLINRILKSGMHASGHDGQHSPDEPQARALLQSYRLFKAQLESWYKSLPPQISFPPPSATIGPEPDPFRRILRSRYLAILELLCRPFVRICLNHTLSLNSDLIDEIASVASEGLQCCAWRLQAIRTLKRLDHGVWIWVRNSTACSMILIGAARSSMFPELNAAARLRLSENWRENILAFLEGVEMFSREPRGGVRECYRLICSSIEGLHDTESPSSVVALA